MPHCQLLLNFKFLAENVSSNIDNFSYDVNEEYTPGARMYFDAKQLAENGLMVRDGLHYKVRDRLPLEYVLFTATINNIFLKDKITPKTFSEEADKEFFRTINKK